MLVRWHAGEKVKRGGRQRVLIGAAIDISAHQLLGRSVGHRAHDEVSRGKSTDVTEWSRNSEVG